MAKRLTIVLVTAFLGFQLTSCYRVGSDSEMIHTGPDKFTSLVVFFKKEATREQIDSFDRTILSGQKSSVNGHDLPDGVALRYMVRNGDYEGIGLTFATDASAEQREKLKKAIKESTIVYKVYENVIPNDIKDL